MKLEKPSTGELLDMKLDLLLGRWPNTARVLIANRMACIGCDFAKFHSTHQALEVYGLERDPFIKDLENALM
jgi:hybrid cluster-associated redox disulfide protein